MTDANQTDRETCYFCSEDNEAILEQHHLLPQRYGGSDTDENLVELCPTCHVKIERLYDKELFGKIDKAVNKNTNFVVCEGCQYWTVRDENGNCKICGMKTTGEGDKTATPKEIVRKQGEGVIR